MVDGSGNLQSDRLKMAEILGHQYYSIGREPFQDLGDSGFLDQLDFGNDGLSWVEIDPEEVKGYIAGLPLKSGPGPDGIPPTVLNMGEIPSWRLWLT